MLITKVIILGFLFLISGGAVFSRYFQGKIILELLAGLIASLSVIYLVHEELKQQVPGVEALAGNKEAGVEASAGNKEATTPPVNTPVPPVSLPTLTVVTPAELPLTSNGTVDFDAVLHPRRDEFETKEEFAVRRGNLLKQFNQAVQQRNLLVQAGVVHLEKQAYDVDSGMFKNLRLEWSTWSTALGMSSRVTIQVPRDEAKTLYNSGPSKPFFITLTSVANHSNDSLAITKIFLAELGKEIEIIVSKSFCDTIKGGMVCPEMVIIPAGSFRMGDIQGTGGSNEQPVHTVQVKSFEMRRHEVTFAEYDNFAEQTGREKPDDEGWGRDNRPVINVSWEDATAYAEWLSQVTGDHYRLPTEAEWEYAARAGTETDYWWGNTASHDYANYGGYQDGKGSWGDIPHGLVQGKDQWEFTAPVCSFVDNPFGLCDTVGNVQEWTCSEDEDKYNGKELECTCNDGSLCVIRGGAWDSESWVVRASFRSGHTFVTQGYTVGFRLVRM